MEVIEGLAAHVGLDADAKRVAPIVDHRKQARIEDIDDQQTSSGGKNPEPVLAGQQLIDIELDDHGEAQFEQADDDCAAEIEEKQALIGRVIGEKSAQHRRIAFNTART